MTRNPPVHGLAHPVVRVAACEDPPMDLHDWAAACAQAMRTGQRMLTLYGRRVSADQALVTAVLLREPGGMAILRGRGPIAQGYPSLTAEFPSEGVNESGVPEQRAGMGPIKAQSAAVARATASICNAEWARSGVMSGHAGFVHTFSVQMFERELWEQTGLEPLGHPWLKPVRFEGERQCRLGDYPFFTVRGQEVHEVGVGPIHASVIEPGHFRFMCHGEQVHHLEIQLGWQHRGIEALMLQRPPLALATLAETIAGDTSIAHAWAYCAAVEALGGVALPIEAEFVRGVALELERIAMHLVALTGLATDIAFLQGGATYGRLRTAIINATMRVCGSRFGRGWLRPGGVRHGITPALRADLLKTLSGFSRDFSEVNALVLGARSVQSRFQGVGTVSHRAATDIGMVGLAARASGVALDMRTSLPGRLHERQPAELLIEPSGDCWARMVLRMREVDASLRWLEMVLGGDVAASLDAPLQAPARLDADTLCVSVREGFRGPVVHALETDGDGRLLHYKVQDPSLLNWFGLALAVRHNEISDFPLCNKSFDLSYCGNDL